jgi:hypothetical protein
MTCEFSVMIKSHTNTYQKASGDVPCDLAGSQDPRYTLHLEFVSNHHGGLAGVGDIPFGRSALLLDLSKDTFSLVVDAVCARRHLAVALDLLLPTHIASLWNSQSALRIREREASVRSRFIP